ncbi:unnamed protein product [Amoebophrya sp. A120]|nr:unnamed protein product [Amoebophrya sp. A120]|eukprot:GSA120T00026015001.1
MPTLLHACRGRVLSPTTSVVGSMVFLVGFSVTGMMAPLGCRAAENHGTSPKMSLADLPEPVLERVAAGSAPPPGADTRKVAAHFRNLLRATCTNAPWNLPYVDRAQELGTELRKLVEAFAAVKRKRAERAGPFHPKLAAVDKTFAGLLSRPRESKPEESLLLAELLQPYLPTWHDDRYGNYAGEDPRGLARRAQRSAYPKLLKILETGLQAVPPRAEFGFAFGVKEADGPRAEFGFLMGPNGIAVNMMEPVRLSQEILAAFDFLGLAFEAPLDYTDDAGFRTGTYLRMQAAKVEVENPSPSGPQQEQGEEYLLTLEIKLVAPRPVPVFDPWLTYGAP